ncbi:hypothetical protein EYF80_003750 [Liparis tanakae]|uniref:Uncharacterized protein n=1 Tax=Liparis tanakae TaxID=230148 RepID=A0A4Z2J6U1_9TELE|nr:hypothetical protein EYF80_003750 [Liparis tanakae]
MGAGPRSELAAGPSAKAFVPRVRRIFLIRVTNSSYGASDYESRLTCRPRVTPSSSRIKKKLMKDEAAGRVTCVGEDAANL